MEKVFFSNSRGIKLSGVIHAGNLDCCVLISHGSFANKNRERLVRLAGALNECGFSVFRFDFSGCGESQDLPITVFQEVDDLKSAIAFMKARGCTRFGLMGESLGGLVSLLACDSSVYSMVLWVPFTDAKKSSMLEDPKVKEELEREGKIVFQKDGKALVVPRQYFVERERVNQKDLLAGIRIPVLIIHGTDDGTVPLAQSRQAVKLLPKGSELFEVRGGSHTLDKSMDLLSKVIEKTVDWMAGHLNCKT